MKQNTVKSKSTLFKKKQIENQKANLLTINVKKTKTRQSKSKEKLLTKSELYSKPISKYLTMNTKGDETCRYTNNQLQKLKTFFETTQEQTLKTNRKSINVKHFKNSDKKNNKSKSKQKSKSATKRKADEKTLRQLREEFKKKINTFLPQKSLNRNKSQRNIGQYAKTTRAISTKLQKNDEIGNNKKKKQRHTLKSKTQLPSSSVSKRKKEQQLEKDDSDFDQAIKQKYQFLFEPLVQNKNFQIKIQQPCSSQSQQNSSSNCLELIQSLKKHKNASKERLEKSVQKQLHSQSLIQIGSNLQQNQIKDNNQYLLIQYKQEQNSLKTIQNYINSFIQCLKFIKNAPKIPLSPITSPKIKKQLRKSQVHESNLLSISQDFIIDTVPHNKSIFEEFRTSNKKTQAKSIIKIRDFFKEQEDKWKKLKQSLQKLKKQKISVSGKHIDPKGQEELVSILLEVQKNHQAIKNLEFISLDEYNNKQHQQIHPFENIALSNKKSQLQIKDQVSNSQYIGKVQCYMDQQQILFNQRKELENELHSSNQFVQQQCPQFIRSPKLNYNEIRFQKFDYTQQDPQFTQFKPYSLNLFEEQQTVTPDKKNFNKLSYDEAPLQITKLLRKKRPSNQQIQELNEQLSREISQKELLHEIQVMQSLSDNKGRIQQKLGSKNKNNTTNQKEDNKQSQNKSSFIDEVLNFTITQQVSKTYSKQILIQQFPQQVVPNINLTKLEKQNNFPTNIHAKLSLKNLFAMQAKNQLIKMAENLKQQDKIKLAQQITASEIQNCLYDFSLQQMQSILQYINYNSIMVQNQQSSEMDQHIAYNDLDQYKVSSNLLTMKGFINAFFTFLSKSPQKVNDIKRRVRTPIGINSKDLLKYMRKIKRQNQLEQEDDIQQLELQQQNSPYQYVIDLQSLIQFQQDHQNVVESMQNTVYQRAFNQSLFDFANLVLDQMRPYGQKGLPPVCFPLKPQQYPQKSLKLMQKIIIRDMQRLQQPEKVGQSEQEIQLSIKHKIKHMITISVEQVQKQLKDIQGNDFQIQFELMNLVQQQILLLQSIILKQYLHKQQQLYF